MPTARIALGAATATNGKIYAIGGCLDYQCYYSFSTAVEEYDPAINTWTEKSSMPTARGELAVLAHPNGKVYAIGGVGDPNAPAAVEEYNPATDTWKRDASLPFGREWLGAAVGPDGGIYAIGGTTIYGTVLADVDRYDPSTNTWAAVTNLTTAQSRMGVTRGPKGKIFVIGGESPSGGPVGTNQVGTVVR
jgi:N-acetylneuraminic acid mutarotase